MAAKNDMNRKRVNIASFGGYRHTDAARLGEWYDMCNLSDRYLPLLTPRKARPVFMRLANAAGVDSLLLKNGCYLYCAGNAIYQNDVAVPIHQSNSDVHYYFVEAGNRVLCLNPEGVERGYLEFAENEQALHISFVPFLQYEAQCAARDDNGQVFSPNFYYLYSTEYGLYQSQIRANNGTLQKSPVSFSDGEYDAQCADFLNIAFKYCVEEDDGSLQILNLAHLCTQAEIDAMSESRYYIAYDKKLYRFDAQSGAHMEITTPKIALFLRTGILSEGVRQAPPEAAQKGDMVRLEIGRSINLSLPYSWVKTEEGYVYNQNSGISVDLKVEAYEVIAQNNDNIWHSTYGWDCYYIFDYHALFTEWLIKNNLIHDSEHYARITDLGSSSYIEGLSFETHADTPATLTAQELRFHPAGTQKYYPASIKISTVLPENMTATVAHNNRIWCADNAHNEIRASALGNYKNWTDYSALSSDSYAVSVGSDEHFHCSCVLGENLYFFKEHSFTVVYGTRPSNFCTNTVSDFIGMDTSGAKSLQVIGNQAYYLGIDGRVYRFNGSRAFCISACFGDARYRALSAAHSSEKYFVLLENEQGRKLFVYNTESGMWFCEDDAGIDALINLKTHPYALCAASMLDNGAQSLAYTDVLDIDAFDGALKNDVEWHCTGGWLGLENDCYQYVQYIRITYESEVGAQISVLAAFDNSEHFELLFEDICKSKQTKTVRLSMKRCAYFRLRLKGKGFSKVYKIAYEVQQGSEK